MLPDQYPDTAPLITFDTEVFHPLVAGNASQTSTGKPARPTAEDSEYSASLPTGGFSLQHGFPSWFTQQTPNQPDTPDRKKLGKRLTARAGFIATTKQRRPHIAEALQYLKRAFSDETLLDALNYLEVVNADALKAWLGYRSLRTINKREILGAGSGTGNNWTNGTGTNGASSSHSDSMENEKWAGIWESEVRSIVSASTLRQLLSHQSSKSDDIVSNYTLFYTPISDQIQIRFADLDDDLYPEIAAEIRRRVQSSSITDAARP